MPIVAYFAMRKLIAKEELFNRYGKYFWCYEDNFKTLNRKQKLVCTEYYDIRKEDWISTPFVGTKKRAPKKATTAVQSNKKIKK